MFFLAESFGRSPEGHFVVALFVLFNPFLDLALRRPKACVSGPTPRQVWETRGTSVNSCGSSNL